MENIFLTITNDQAWVRVECEWFQMLVLINWYISVIVIGIILL